MAITKGQIDLINIQGTSSQLETVKTQLTNTQKAIFTATDTKRMYLCEYGKDAVMLGSEVQSVTYDSTTTKLTITPVSGAPIIIDLAIDSALTTLETQITTAYTNAIATAKTEVLNTAASTYVPKTAIKSETVGDSREQVYSVEAINSTVKNLGQLINKNVAKVTGNLVSGNIDTTYTNAPEVNLFYDYDSDDKKIYFYRDKAKENKVGEGIDVTPFIKDGMLSDTEIVVASTTTPVDGNTTGTFIKFTWNIDGGEKIDYLNVTSLIDTYLAGNGLSLDPKTKTFSINLVSNSGLNLSDTGLGVKAGNGIVVDANGVAVDNEWLASNVVHSVKVGNVVLKGLITFQGAQTTSDNGSLTGVIDVHPKWYTVS